MVARFNGYGNVEKVSGDIEALFDQFMFNNSSVCVEDVLDDAFEYVELGKGAEEDINKEPSDELLRQELLHYQSLIRKY